MNRAREQNVASLEPDERRPRAKQGPDEHPAVAIEISNRQQALAVDVERLEQAARAVLAGEGVTAAAITIGIVDDRAIHDLNRRFLNHDEPTDVLSFRLSDDDRIEGDVILGARRRPARLRSADRPRPTKCCFTRYMACCTCWATTI